MTIQHCARCGEEITSIHIFEGRKYGYTCITKVNPGVKRSKGFYVETSWDGSKVTDKYNNGRLFLNGYPVQVIDGVVFFYVIKEYSEEEAIRIFNKKINATQRRTLVFKGITRQAIKIQGKWYEHN